MIIIKKMSAIFVWDWNDIPTRPSIFEWFLYDAVILIDFYWLSLIKQWFSIIHFRTGNKTLGPTSCIVNARMRRNGKNMFAWICQPGLGGVRRNKTLSVPPNFKSLRTTLYICPSYVKTATTKQMVPNPPSLLIQHSSSSPRQLGLQIMAESSDAYSVSNFFRFIMISSLLYQ